MRFEVEAAGRRRSVDVQRAGEGWAITVDGRAMSASVSRVGARWSLLYGDAGASPKRSYEGVLEIRDKGRSLVHIDGRVVTVSFLDRVRGSRTAGPFEGGAGARDVVAPMPGRIVKVLVKAGDVVAVGQGLVVVEAMKMENELRAPRAGTIASIRASEGMSVEANTVLVVVE